ncbi:signal peptidase I [Enterococcus termitis]|nr:signal peptidase I [Enterococcus termitis]OJG99395.1 signal peptidase I [Enterococcus termitis]
MAVTEMNRKKHPNKKRTPRKKTRKKRKKNHRYKELSQEIGITCLIVVVLGVLCSQFVFALPQTIGYGMRESLNDGDRVYVNRLGKLRRFSLVYFKQPDGNGTSIRRIIGLPQETVRYSNDELYINDRLIVERFLQRALAQAKLDNEMITEDFDSADILKTNTGMIPKDKYLVLGDNRKYATDSRYYGVVDKQMIIGTVELRWWPFYQVRSY